MNPIWTTIYTFTKRVDALSLRGGVCVAVPVWVEMPQKDFIAHEPGGSSR